MLSVSVMAGFPYADVPDMGAAIIAVADADASLATTTAKELSRAMWTVRHELSVTCPTAPEAVRAAIATEEYPVVLVDLGDNVGGGSPGDGTVILAELLRQNATGSVVTLYLARRRAGGNGGRHGASGPFQHLVGGHVDENHGDPVDHWNRSVAQRRQLGGD